MWVAEVVAALGDELELGGRYCVLELHMRGIQSLVELKGVGEEMTV